MLTYYEAKSGSIWTLDFLPTAPAAAKPELAGTRSGPTSAGVPGLLAGLDALHRKFGLRPWKELVQPAIAFAREGGMPSDPRLAPRDLTTTLLRISEAGPRDFYDGEIAGRIVTNVKSAGGVFAFQDLRSYAPVWRAPMQIQFNGYDIYAPPAPSAGALVIGETLNILRTFDLVASGFQSPKTIHLVAEALRRASIDRSHYISDRRPRDSVS